MEELGFLSTVLEVIIYLLGFFVVVLTVLPFLKLSVWWVRLGDFPRVQIAFVGIFTIIIMLIFSRPLFNYNLAIILILLLCVVYQIFCILPYLFIYPNQVELTKQKNPKNTIKLLISNVLIENNESAKLLALIEKVNPDVILLAETNQRWLNALEPLDKNYPHLVKKPLNNAYGMALFSRLELIDPEIKFLVEDDIPSIHTDIKLASGKIVKLHGIHPRPPFPSASGESTERDAELVSVGKMVKDTKVPTIIAGDLNDVAWSRTTALFQKISEMLDPRIGRGMYSSFHAEYPFMRFPLDHVFHSNHFRLVELKRLSYIGSDHFPLLIVLNIENDAEKTQDEPEANSNEMKEANEMIEDAKEKN